MFMRYLDGDLSLDPAIDVWYGFDEPDEEWFEEEEEVPEWKHRMIIRRRGKD